MGTFRCHTLGEATPAARYRVVDEPAFPVSGIATGDQGIFVRRELFERVGGYPILTSWKTLP